MSELAIADIPTNQPFAPSPGLSPLAPAMQAGEGALLSEYKNNGCGIYGICNIVTGQWYVGQSIRFWIRIRDEARSLDEGFHHCRWLQRSYNKHGFNSFRWYVLGEYEESLLNEKELEWITIKRNNGGVYNSKIASDCGRFWTVTPEVAEIIRKNKLFLMSLPLWKHSHMKAMWSDERKSDVARQKALRLLNKSNQRTGFNLTLDTFASFVRIHLLNGIPVKTLNKILKWDDKQEMRRISNYVGINCRKLVIEWQNQLKTLILSGMHVSEIESVYDLERNSIYMFASRNGLSCVKYRKPRSSCPERGVND